MKKECRDVIYLVGDGAEKRRIFRGGLPGVARADSDEVTGICRMEGRDYYSVGRHPFGGFTVAQYVRYQRSLTDGRATDKRGVRAALGKLGLRVGQNRRLGSLGFVERRLVALAGRVDGNTRTLAIDLDGAPYSRRLRSALRRAVRRLRRDYEIWISVTDSRFAGPNATVARLGEGSIISMRRRDLYSRPLSRRILLARLRRCFVPAPAIEKGTIVEVSRRQ